MAEALAPAAPPTPATPTSTPAATTAATAAAVATPASPTPPATPATTPTQAAPATPAPAAPVITAPEKYSAFAVPKGLPEGHTLNEGVVQSVEKVSRTLGLTQDRAQALVDEVVPSIYRQGQQHLDAMVKDWQSQIQNHKTLGGERLVESQKTVDLALEKLGTPELKQFMDSPFQPGKHPAMWEFLHKVGQLMKQDGFPTSGRGPSSGADAPTDDAALAAKLYPKSQQQGQ